MADRDSKDFPRIKASDKVLHDKALNIAKNPKYDGYQLGRASFVCKCLYKRSSDDAVPSEIMSNQQLGN